jgi:hypothetical protein
MRLKFVVAAAAALAFVGPTAAHAQLALTLDPLGPAPIGSMVTVTGTITNTGGSGQSVDGTTPSLNPSTGDASAASLASIVDLFGPMTPIDLAGGANTGDIPLFSFTMDNTVKEASYYVYGLNASGSAIATDVTATTAVTPSAIPEPGSVGLLVGGALGGGLFLLRRRRK